MSTGDWRASGLSTLVPSLQMAGYSALRVAKSARVAAVTFYNMVENTSDAPWSPRIADPGAKLSRIRQPIPSHRLIVFDFRDARWSHANLSLVARNEETNDSIGCDPIDGSVWLMRLDLGLLCATIAPVIRSFH